MADINIKIEGLDEIRQRMQAYPDVWKREVSASMQQSLLTIWEIVGRLGYPRRPVTKTNYIRTGTLGRSLGIGLQGGKMGEPSIYQVRTMGMDATGEFGTNLKYAPYVVGEEQAWFHRLVWWTIPGTVYPVAKARIETIFKELGEDLAKWLNR